MLARSSQDFANAYASNKQGIGIGIENFIHLKKETTPGTFNPPSVGTQGKSTSDTTPSTDISAGTDTTFRIAVDGGAVVTVVLVVTGLTTGSLIAAALETGINAALTSAGQDARVWVEFAGGLYVLHSQKFGAVSAVVVTAGLTNDVSADLKIGVANAGTEIVGTYGGNFLFMTKAGLKFNQPFEMSEHKSGRQASNVIKKKKVAEGDLEMYFNFDTTGGSPDIDTPVEDLLEGVLGRKVVTGSSIKFDAGSPSSNYLSVLQGNNAFGRALNGTFPKSLKIALPGDGEAKMTLPLKARTGRYATIAQLMGAVVASANIIVNAGESKRFDVDSRVMVVKPDGRSVVAGSDGSLTVLSRTDGSDTVVLSTTVSVADDGYLVPWLPHVFDQHGIDNPVTGLQGSVSFDNGSTVVEEIRSVEIDFDPKIEAFDNFYGADENRGFVVGGRAEINVTLDVLLSVSQMRKVIEAKEFTYFNLQVTLGPSSGRRLVFSMPHVLFMVPDVEIPDEGSIPIQLQGKCLQSAPGALDALTLTYL